MSKWEVAFIPTVLFFQEGPGVRNTQYKNSGVKLLNVANLQEGEIDLSTSDRFISIDEAYGRYSHFMVDAGDLIIASSGIKVDYFDKKMGVVSSDQLPLCMNTSTIRFKVLDKSIIDLRFFMYYLKTNSFKLQLSKQIVGSAQLNFGPSHLKKMTVPLPPIHIQKQIVAELDAVSEVLRLRKAQLAELDNLVKSQFNEISCPCYEQGRMTPLELMIQNDRPITYGILMPGENIEGGIPVVKVKNFPNGFIDKADMLYTSPEIDFAYRRSKLIPGDLLISIRGSVGKVAEVPNSLDGANITQDTARLSICPEYSSKYIKAALESEMVQNDIKNQIKGVAVKGINLGSLRKIKLPVPDNQKQDDFAAFYNQVERIKAEIQQSLDETQRLFDSLMAEYFEA